MKLKCITLPSIEPVGLTDVENQCRIGSLTAELSAVGLFITAVRQKAEATTRRALITQQWVLTLDGFPGSGSAICLPLPPVQSVDSIVYIDAAGDEQELDTALYRLIDDEPAYILPAYGTVWPDTLNDVSTVVVTFTAGYGDAAEDVPAAIRQWLLLNIANLYENRETETVATGMLKQVDLSTMADALLENYRVRSF